MIEIAKEAIGRPHRKTGKNKKCEYCNGLFYVSKCRLHIALYCSRKCKDKGGRVERRAITCEVCKTEFEAVMGHGVWPKYCSRDCFFDGTIKPELRICPTCDKEFLAKRSAHNNDGLITHCSKTCYGRGRRHQGTRHVCPVCNKTFWLSVSVEKHRGETCSAKCQNQYYKGPRHPCWKGGEYIDAEHNKIVVNHPREGFVSNYVGKHRVLASEATGRVLNRNEPVIFINDDKSDCRPENLYICYSFKELRGYQHGFMQQPQKSNLGTYK